MCSGHVSTHFPSSKYHPSRQVIHTEPPAASDRSLQLWQCSRFAPDCTGAGVLKQLHPSPLFLPDWTAKARQCTSNRQTPLCLTRFRLHDVQTVAPSPRTLQVPPPSAAVPQFAGQTGGASSLAVEPPVTAVLVVGTVAAGHRYPLHHTFVQLPPVGITPVDSKALPGCSVQGSGRH